MSKLFNSIVMSVLILCSCSNIGKNSKTDTTEVSDVKCEERLEFIADYSTMEEAEIEMIEFLELKYGDPDNFSPYHEFVDFVINEPRTIDYPFEKLQNDTYVGIVTSDDGNLRLYYWNDGFGGTMISWTNICQYVCNDKVYAYRNSISEVAYGCFAHEDSEDDFGCAVLGIETIYDNNNAPIYLVHTYNRYSSNHGYAAVEAIRIIDGKLVAAPIFNGGEVDEIEDDFYKCFRGSDYSIADWYFRANNGEGWDWLFRYDDDSEMLYVPQADFSLSDRYSIYHFNGSEFNYVGVDGGFWLHPTLRSFEFMELVMETKGYRVRVDRMYDGSYRYASWNNRGSMDKEPDLILYNGIYNDETTDYHFKHDEYEYIIDEEKGLVVKCNGKNILSQERVLNY